MQIKELTELELLELSLKYSISSKHKKSLKERINKIKKPVQHETKQKVGQIDMFGR